MKDGIRIKHNKRLLEILENKFIYNYEKYLLQIVNGKGHINDYTNMVRKLMRTIRFMRTRIEECSIRKKRKIQVGK